MLVVNFKQIYESSEFGEKEWVLILYDISFNHYVGVPISSSPQTKDYIYLKSINRYANIEKVRDYSRSKMTRCIYEKGKPLRLSNNDYNNLMTNIRNLLTDYLLINIKSNIDGISYLKWCRDKHILNDCLINSDKLKQNAIYWINMGYNIGSELRKLRPAILWRPSGDKKTWTMIPLTTKKRNDEYYFHYDLECLNDGTAKIESMMNYSYKRIISPYFSKNKLAIITKKDYQEIAKIIEKYYLFK